MDTQAVIPIIITCIAVLVITVITASFITATVTLIKDKYGFELEHAKIRMNTEIYEEIDCNQIPASPVNTNKNVAYAEVSKN